MDLISEFCDGIRYFGYWTSPVRFGRQFPVRTREQVIHLLNTYNGVYNCGISMCTFIDDVPYLLYLPFDFDSDDLKMSWEDAKVLYNFMVDSGYDVSINYSGYRGFHILVTTVPKPYTRSQIRAIQKFFKRALNLETCDKKIFGDVRRLIRIPGTVHTGKFRKDNNIWVRVNEGGLSTNIKYTPGEPLDLDEMIIEDELDIESSYDYSDVDFPIHPYPCIEKFMNNEEPPQLIRYSYVAYWLRMGKSPEDIISMLEIEHGNGAEHEWLDWDLDKTTYQVNQIANGTYNPLKCDTLKDLDYCIKDCIYYTDDWEVKRLKDVNNKRDD